MNMDQVNFLWEIGTEEIPAGYIPPAIQFLKNSADSQLKEKRLSCKSIDVYATPRRLVLAVSGLADVQKEETVVIKGPSKKAAYNPDGTQSKALQGFMKANDLNDGDLYEEATDKGDYLCAKKKLESLPAEEIIPGLLTDLLTGIPFPKKMRWSSKKLAYPRPVAYFLVMFNDKVIPFEIEGITSSNRTRGHFIQHNKMIDVPSIRSYPEILRAHGVILDQNERRDMILAGASAAAEKAGGHLKKDDELLETVTFIVENPHPVVCDFSADYLSIPDIVLIAEMKEHQKYFAITGSTGRLMNKFIAVSNNPPTQFIKEGNERVITARFNDARFFYTEDRKTRLIDRVDQLKDVLFHKELGSIYDKIERMLMFAGYISESLHLDEKTREKINRAVLLSKTDLVTAMVFEFSSLQGKIGAIYALEDGEDADVAEAIDLHYRPRFHGDDIPESIIAIVLSISEKLDNIFGSFSVGNIPKGSQDPYALRRQANAVVDIIIKRGLSLSLEKILHAAAPSYRDGSKLVDKIIEFVNARVKTIFSDSGFNHDEIDACLSTGSTDYLENFRRAQSLNSFRRESGFSELLLAFKRMNNLLSAFRRDNAEYSLKFNESLFEHDSERELFSFFDSRKAAIKDLITASDYISLFKMVIEARGVIDLFFDKVLVMDKRTEYRDNRLFMLESILSNFRHIIDFSKISDK
jgi:glycyl-tRNA synthetase beta chain